MKRFFGRFSSSAAASKDEDLREKSPPAMPDPAGGQRVKALAAKYEGFASSPAANPQETIKGGDLSRRGRSSMPPMSATGGSWLEPSPAPAAPPLTRKSKELSMDLTKSIPAYPVSASAAQMSQHSRSTSAHKAQTQSTLTQQAPSLPPSQPSLEHLSRSSSDRQHGSSVNGHGSSEAPQPTKTVAFAPSPKKPSHAAGHMGSMSASAATLSQDDISVHSFARPTIASSARARNISAGHRGSDVPYLGEDSPSLAASLSTNSRPATAPRLMMRSNSSSGRVRTVGGGTAGSSDGHGAPTSSSLSPLSTGISGPMPLGSGLGGAGASTASLAQGGDGPAPNSIPFVTGSSHGHLRSASPQSFNTGGWSRRGSQSAAHGGDGSGSDVGHGMSMGRTSSGARSIGGPSWSEMTEGDLVSNLGQRERTRQEVLWEIVASEERYVTELEKAKALYIDTLLHPMRFSPPQSPHTGGGATLSLHASPRGSFSPGEASTSAELPIAARFMSAGMTASALGTSTSESNSRRSSAVGSRPLSTGAVRVSSSIGHQAPPLLRNSSSSAAAPTRRTSQTTPAATQLGYNASDLSALNTPLPPALRAVLEAITEGIIDGHAQLSEALKMRYEEQWPLVRSLADVFLRHDYVLKHYANYVVNLERALEHLEEAALMERAMRGKRIKKERLTQAVGLGRAIASLEAAALERGECGLSIFISMPFQRLLKYPLLFQNLLFHTDPSTHEFESTVGMVVDVERMVRSIEDEKISAEERDKVRDAFARIEAIMDRQVLKPRPDRLLIEERPMYEEGPRRALSESAPKDDGGISNGPHAGSLSRSSNSSPSVAAAAAASGNGTSAGMHTNSNSSASATGSSLRAQIRSKRSYRRLSDFLGGEDKSTKAPSMGSKRDLWLVRFSDVELRCQRIGVTALPMASSVVIGPGAAASASAAADSKERLKALRNTTLRAKTRNLYRFVAVNSWRKAAPGAGEISGDERGDGIVEEDEDDDEEEDDESDASEETEAGLLDMDRYVRQSKLSFSYWGNDRIEPRRASGAAAAVAASLSPMPSLAANAGAAAASRRRSGAPSADPLSVITKSHAKARQDKFGARLRGMTGPESVVTEAANLHHLAPANASRRSIVRSSTAAAAAYGEGGLPGVGGTTSSASHGGPSGDAQSQQQQQGLVPPPSTSNGQASGRPGMPTPLSSVSSDLKALSPLIS